MKWDRKGVVGCGIFALLVGCTSPRPGTGPKAAQPEGVDMDPNVCTLTHHSTLVVKATISGVGAATQASQAGLSTADSQTLFLDPSTPVVPLSLVVDGPPVVHAGIATPPSTLSILFPGSGAPDGPDGKAASGGYFFLTRDAGNWVCLYEGFFTRDAATGLFWNPGEYRGSEISEADLQAKIAAAQQSSAPCLLPVCPEGGAMTDAGTCIPPDAGPPVFWDAGQRQP